MRTSTSFLLVLAASLLFSACVTDPLDEVDEAGPIENDAPPTQQELDANGKADWFGVSNPETWRRFWYATYYYHLKTPIEAGVPRPAVGGTRTVLLIPGTTIGPEFMEPMAARLRRDGFDPVIWAPSDLFTQSLELGAQRIGAKVQQVLAERGATRLHVIAECDAGVAARYYAQVLGGHRNFEQMITFVSAHNGTSAAPIGSWVTGFQALKDVKPGSAFMKRLASAPMPAGFQLTSIYSCRDEYMYPYTTSRVTGATNVEFCSHPLYHFDGFWDRTVYDRMFVTLIGQGASAPRWY